MSMLMSAELATANIVMVGPILAVALPVAVVVPIVFYPVSYTLWAAVDLATRPMEPHEVADAAAAVAACSGPAAAVPAEDA